MLGRVFKSLCKNKLRYVLNAQKLIDEENFTIYSFAGIYAVGLCTTEASVYPIYF